MRFEEYFPVWKELTPAQQSRISAAVFFREVPKGTLLHNGSADCTGVMLLCAGQLRAYILSEEGREITVYRLLERDVCLFSASCMMRSLRFDITIEAEKDSKLWVVPVEVYQQVMRESAPLANFTNELMASRLSDTMWLIEQILWKSQDKRLASFLLEETALEESDTLKITHETIGNHLGTAREVVTRMLRYFQSEGMVKLSRGTVEVTDRSALKALSV